jgi:superfamily II DNA or RNA helicase
MNATVDATRLAIRLFDGRNPLPPAGETTVCQHPAESLKFIPSPFVCDPCSSRPLHPHQERALAGVRASWASGHRRQMVQMPTGAGKTKFAAKIIDGALSKGRRIAFVVPRLSLIDQTIAAFAAEGIHCIGVMQGVHPRTNRDAPVQICSIQTVTRRKRPKG